MKAYTDIEQSKKLAEFLPLKNADMWFHPYPNDEDWYDVPNIGKADLKYNQLPCWSLAALLKCLSELKPQVYIPILFPSEGKWILQFVEYGHGNVCEVSCDNPIDACYEAVLEQRNYRKLVTAQQLSDGVNISFEYKEK